VTILMIIGNGGSSGTRELNNQKEKKKLKWRGCFWTHVLELKKFY